MLAETGRGTVDADQALVVRAQRGDKRAFDVLVRKYQHKVTHLIARYLRDKNEVVDLAQETFIKTYLALPSFRGDSAFYTWLYRIAVNTVKNHLVSREGRFHAVSVDADEEAWEEHVAVLHDLATPESLLLRDELEGTVFRAIAKLPDELREAITLRELEGLSYEEIAQAMGCPVGTVRSRIFRAREAIDQEIRPLLER